MATITVARPDVYPDGTTVEARVARPAFPRPDQDTAPLGTAAASASMSSGTAALTGLADGTLYEVVGSVGGKYRRVYVRTVETSTGLGPLVDNAATNPNGTARPSWRKRRRTAGLV